MTMNKKKMFQETDSHSPQFNARYIQYKVRNGSQGTFCQSQPVYVFVYVCACVCAVHEYVCVCVCV